MPGLFCEIALGLPAPGGHVSINRGARHSGGHICRSAQVHAAGTLAGAELACKKGRRHQSYSPERQAQAGMNCSGNQGALTGRSHRAFKRAVFRGHQRRGAGAENGVRYTRHRPLADRVTPTRASAKCQHRKDCKNYGGFLDHTLILLSLKTFQFKPEIIEYTF